MVLVCASHVDHHFAGSPLLSWLFLTTTRVATPTFLLLSGFIIGYLLRTSRRRIGLTLIDRALFLLLVAHWAIGLAHIGDYGVREWLLVRASIIDAIGVALFAAVLLRARSPVQLAAAGASLFLISWYVAMTFTPQSEWASGAAAVLFDVDTDAGPLLDLALIPYVGVFLLGMALSGYLHAPLLARDDALIATKLLRIAGAALVTVAAAIVAWKVGERLLPAVFAESSLTDALRQTLDPRSKRPPSPAYLLFYGGAGLLLLALLFKRWPRWFVDKIGPPARLIGQASLIAFIAQDWLLFVIPKVLGFDMVQSIPFWLAYLALCIYAIYRLARTWQRHNGNRLFTVGLKALGRRRRPRRFEPRIAGTEQASPSWTAGEDGWIVPAGRPEAPPLRRIPRSARG
jgi:hypothetical protein